MLVQIDSSSHLEQLVNTHNLVFVDFWAEWCAPCKHFAKVYENVAQKFPEVVFAKVNVEQVHDLNDIFQVRSIPHLVVFKQNIVIYSESGSMPESSLTELVQQGIAVDVSDIKDKLE